MMHEPIIQMKNKQIKVWTNQIMNQPTKGWTNKPNYEPTRLLTDL